MCKHVTEISTRKESCKTFLPSLKQANFPPKMTSLTQDGLQECKILIFFNKMAANAKDCRWRQLPNHLHNRHLLH